MKKFIKISLLILFIIFVLGITTSNAAYYVTPTTKPADMLNALNNGNKLTGISYEIKDRNPYLYCVHRNISIYSVAEYEAIGSATFPDDDPIYGHAKAYIFAAPGYIKNDDILKAPDKNDERQWAWYVILGQETSGNDLYNIAIAYQNYKNTEKDVKIIEDPNAKTTVSGDNIMYGPLQIEYSYNKAVSGSKSDEWGGFNYAFFDEEGNNISDKVKLCTLLDDGSYREITSALISSNDEINGYYKVSTAEYNTVDLYIAVTEKNITKVNMSIRANMVDYEATVTELSGEYYESGSGLSYCDECRNSSDKYYDGYLWKQTSKKTKFTDWTMGIYGDSISVNDSVLTEVKAISLEEKTELTEPEPHNWQKKGTVRSINNISMFKLWYILKIGTVA